VVLIHFPIALFIAAVTFGFLAQWTKRQFLAAAAYCNLLAASSGHGASADQRNSRLAVATRRAGAQGRPLDASAAWLRFECADLGGVCLVHVRAQRKHRGLLPGYRLPIEAAAVTLVILTGHLGGFLSGVNVPS